MERNGLGALLHEWHRRFIGPVTDSRTVYAGFALFFAGVGLVVVSIATFLWSTTTDPAGTFKFVLRQLAVLAGAAGIPTVLLGVTVLLPVSRRVDAVSAAGVGLCLVATARFAQVYPDAWYPNASVVVGLYAFGAVVVVATAGTALSSYHAEQTGRRIAREQLDRNSDGAAAADADGSGGETVTDEQVQADIDEAMSGAEVNWGGVERGTGRSITIRSSDDDGLEVSGASAANATESRGESVDDAVAGLQGLRGEGPQTESSSSGTDEQATALAELRATREESEAAVAADSDGGILARIKSLLGMR